MGNTLAAHPLRLAVGIPNLTLHGKVGSNAQQFTVQKILTIYYALISHTLKTTTRDITK